MSVSSFIFTYLKNKLPDINWNIGSTVRELIASPMVALAESATAALNEQTSAVSIKRMLDNPEEYKDEIENIFNELELSVNNATQSSGVVTIMTRLSTPSAVLKNTNFYAGDQAVYVAQDVYPMLEPDGRSGATQLRQVGYNAYAFQVPVNSTSLSTYLPLNTLMTWDEAPSDIYDIVVTVPISGGRTVMSLEEKLQKIKDYVAPEILSLSDGISKTLRKALPDIVADAVYATDHFDNLANYASITVEDGINKSYLYVKPLKAPGYEYIDVQGYRSETGSYIINTKIIGIIDLIEIYKDNILVSTGQVQLTNNNLYCTAAYTESGAQDTEVFTLKVYRLSNAQIIQDFIDGYTAGSPFKIEVKAPTIFNLTLDFSYSGQEIGSQDYLSMCSRIQSLGLNTAITDSLLESMLNENGANLYGAGSYALSTNTGCCYKQQYSTALYYSIESTSYAIYLGVTDIHAKHI